MNKFVKIVSLLVLTLLITAACSYATNPPRTENPTNSYAQTPPKPYQPPATPYQPPAITSQPARITTPPVVYQPPANTRPTMGFASVVPPQPPRVINPIGPSKVHQIESTIRNINNWNTSYNSGQMTRENFKTR